MDLKEYLYQARMTQGEFSSIIGCSREFLCSIINGRASPGKRLARDIVIETQGKVTIEELFNPIR